VKERDAYTCANPECARRTVRVHVHHTVFRRNGGTDAGDNLQLECPGCHLRLVHSGHLTIEAQDAWLLFTFRDRVIWMFGHPSRA
jgi:5-methylcytosine-specific restriction endonuclease McrA